MGILVIIGIISLFFGIILLFFPKQFKKLSNILNKVIMTVDENLLKMHIGLGISLIAIGLVCFFLVYYFIKRY